MKGNKAKIEITESELKGLYFTDIYLPVADDPEDSPELVITHHENYIHIMFATKLNPSYMYTGEPGLLNYFDDGFFRDYDFSNFVDLNDSEFTPKGE